MVDEADDLFEVIDTSKEPEYDSETTEDVEIDPDDEEDLDSRRKQSAMEHQFARYELNYRSRRIRELTLGPVKVRSKQGGRSGRPTAA